MTCGLANALLVSLPVMVHLHGKCKRAQLKALCAFEMKLG